MPKSRGWILVCLNRITIYALPLTRRLSLCLRFTFPLQGSCLILRFNDGNAFNRQSPFCPLSVAQDKSLLIKKAGTLRHAALCYHSGQVISPSVLDAHCFFPAGVLLAFQPWPSNVLLASLWEVRASLLIVLVKDVQAVKWVSTLHPCKAGQLFSIRCFHYR